MSLLAELARSTRLSLPKVERRRFSDIVQGLVLPLGVPPGPVRFASRPYMVEPLNVAQDPTISHLYLCMATQVMKTTLLQFIAACFLLERPRAMKWVRPDQLDVRKFNSMRWLPFIDQNPLLAQLKPHDHDNYTKLAQLLGGHWLTFGWMGSPTSLSSDPVEVLIMDEIDKQPTANDREALATDLASERTKAHSATAKVIAASTPTDETSAIMRLAGLGDWRKYHVISPYAPKAEPFVFEMSAADKSYNLLCDESARRKDGSWDYDRVKQTAYYRCPHTGERISDQQRRAMIREEAGAHWKPTNDNPRPGHRSYHLNTFYSPTVSLGTMMTTWLDAQETKSALQNFINSWLAEPWVPFKPDVTEFSDEYAMAEHYSDGGMVQEPEPGELLLLTWDTQAVGFYLVARLWDRATGASRLVAHFQPEQLVDEDDLLAAIQSFGITDPRQAGGDLRGRKGNEIAQFCARHGFIGLRGSESRDFTHQRGRNRKPLKLPYSKIQQEDAFLGKGGGRRLLRSVQWSNPSIFAQLDSFKRGRGGASWMVGRDAHAWYRKQIDAHGWAEKQMPQTGKTVEFWKQFSRDDHAWDCECMQIVLAYLHKVRIPVNVQPVDLPAESDG